MTKRKLQPFKLAGFMDYCPECGATGNYELLAGKVRAILKAWEDAGRYPDTSSDFAKIEAAINDAIETINKDLK